MSLSVTSRTIQFGSLITIRLGIVLVLGCLFGIPATAQSFNSGSDGSDGALSFDPGDGTLYVVDFDPVALGLDDDHDSVYHFTTITIPSNVTVKLRANKAGYAPFVWLASGDVTINGTVDLSGDNGHAASDAVPGTPATPGPGGYPGGWGGSSVLQINHHAGFGPSGDKGRNAFLIPLLGGSGGAGGPVYRSGGGGGGGGAITIASNTSVTVNGLLKANGGDPGKMFYDNDNHAGVAGSGGAIRILAPIVAGGGTISVKKGTAGYASSTAYEGWVRIEALTDSFTGSIVCTRNRRVTLLPSATHYLLPEEQPVLARVVRIAGVELPPSPRGSFVVPDTVLNTDEPVLFEIEAKNIPLGTVFQISLWNQTTYLTEFQSTGLEGTLEASTATATHTIPYGINLGLIYANWTP